MNTLIIPPSSETKYKAERIIASFDSGKPPSMSTVMEKFYANFSEILPGQLHSHFFNLSPGTSQVKAFPAFLEQIQSDLREDKYYRDYSGPSGDMDTRMVLALHENMKLPSSVFSYEDFVITEGTTGAISQIFEYIKEYYQDSEVLIPTPSYYVFTNCAQFYGLKYKEVIMSCLNTSKLEINDILNEISEKTKLIILSQPNNPLGLAFSSDDVIKLLRVAKKRNIFILADEVFFDLFFEDIKKPLETDLLAYRENALQNIIMVKGYSKSRNVPGFRIGYLYSKNTSIVEFISRSEEQRSFFSVGSNFRSIIYLDCLFQMIIFFTKRGANLTDSVMQTSKLLQSFEFFKTLSVLKMTNLVTEYFEYHRAMMQFYEGVYQDIVPAFGKDIEKIMPKGCAFNTFTKIRNMDNVNIFDFTLNLYLSTGILHDSGPCFGLSQIEWETNNKLGYWMRISFSRDKEKMEKGIQTFKIFKELFQRNPGLFMVTGKHY
jgi:aspartate/methionine/tyrosine aminotransferase